LTTTVPYGPVPDHAPGPVNVRFVPAVKNGTVSPPPTLTLPLLALSVPVPEPVISPPTVSV
jgi:hypothetical protein